MRLFFALFAIGAEGSSLIGLPIVDLVDRVQFLDYAADRFWLEWVEFNV